MGNDEPINKVLKLEKETQTAEAEVFGERHQRFKEVFQAVMGEALGRETLPLTSYKTDPLVLQAEII